MMIFFKCEKYLWSHVAVEVQERRAKIYRERMEKVRIGSKPMDTPVLAPTHGYTSVGRPAKIYIYQFYLRWLIVTDYKRVL